MGRSLEKVTGVQKWARGGYEKGGTRGGEEGEKRRKLKDDAMCVSTRVHMVTHSWFMRYNTRDDNTPTTE